MTSNCYVRKWVEGSKDLDKSECRSKTIPASVYKGCSRLLGKNIFNIWVQLHPCQLYITKSRYTHTYFELLYVCTKWVGTINSDRRIRTIESVLTHSTYPQSLKNATKKHNQHGNPLKWILLKLLGYVFIFSMQERNSLRPWMNRTTWLNYIFIRSCKINFFIYKVFFRKFREHKKRL